MEKNLKEIIEAVNPIIEKAGAFIKSECGNVEKGQIEHKALNDLVSYVDKTAEEILVAGLSEVLPEATFITEEQTVERREGEYTWIIDPLDGTTNFLHQIPFFSSTVALMRHGEVVCGWVLEIMQDKMYYAWKGGGAYCNGQPISVSQQSEFNQSLLVTGFPRGQAELLKPYANIFYHFMSSTRGVRRMGSAALDLSYVASGRLDAFYELNLNVWDVAGGVLIVQEAGGQVTDFQGGGDYLFGKRILASNGRMHEAFRERLL